jgi:hypothetical protein
MRNAQKIWAENSEEKRSLGRPKCRWENIEMDLKEIWWSYHSTGS